MNLDDTLCTKFSTLSYAECVLFSQVFFTSDRVGSVGGWPVTGELFNKWIPG